MKMDGKMKKMTKIAMMLVNKVFLYKKIYNTENILFY